MPTAPPPGGPPPLPLDGPPGSPPRATADGTTTAVGRAGDLRLGTRSELSLHDPADGLSRLDRFDGLRVVRSDDDPRAAVDVVLPDPRETGAPVPATGGARRRRLAPTVWTLLVLGGLATPLVVLLLSPAAERSSTLRVVSLATALGALTLLVLTVLLPSRVRAVTAYLGVERLLRQHRFLALGTVTLVVAHVAAVLTRPGNGWHLLDLRSAPPRVWAASTATLALLAVVLLGLSRRRRRPRYEGWRLAHLLLANTAIVATALHVIWLRDLTTYPPARAWFEALGVGVLALTVYRWVWRPLRSRRYRYVVDSVRVESSTAVTVVLHAAGHRGMAFRPGQFAWLKIGSSPFVFEEHPFTIASAATEPWRKEFTIKALGDFSEIVAGMRPGRSVYLDGPHGAFTLEGLRSDEFVFIAGGVGITPMMSMLRTLAERADPRPLLLVVAGRTADELLHRADHEHLADRLDLRVVEVLERPPEDWAGETGRITADVLRRALPAMRRRRHRVDFFVCGPGPMVAAVDRTLAELGVPASRVHTELFDVV